MWKKVRFSDAEAQTRHMVENVLASAVRAVLRREKEKTMQIETMTVEEATQKLRALGLKISTTTLREGIAQGQFPFGSYIKTDKSCVCYVWTRPFEKWVEERT